MSNWESGPKDGLLQLDTGYVRISCIESVVIDEKRWGVTSKGNDVWRATVTLIGGATFTTKTTDTERFISLCAGVTP